jgi:formate dehydrogenase alpha subunit
MPWLTINGMKREAAADQTLLDVAVAAGIEIPTLCYHPDLSVPGSCRVCLVEVSNWDRQVPACRQPALDGMNVQTDTPAVHASRRFVLEMMLRDYVAAAGSPSNEFQKLLDRYHVRLRDGVHPAPRFPVDGDPNPFVRVDMNRCILCTRCVRACDEIQGRFVWRIAQRGHDAHIVAGTGTSMLDARCESCGACAAYCPTGALSDRPAYDAEPPERRVTTTCGYCGVGCQFDINVKDERILRVTSNPSAPVNGMALCVKGRYGHGFVHHADRLTTPLVRKYLLERRCKPPSVEDRGGWQRVGWNTALELVADRFAEYAGRSGPQSTALLASAKCTNEENYLMQKLARQVLGTHSIDHCARLCHSSTVAGLAMCFGSGAMSNSMDDIAEQAGALFIIGSNTTEQHPVFGSMLRQAVLQRGIPLVIADPRKIDMTEFAAVHLRHRPGTDVALLNGIMHWIVDHDRQDEVFIAQRCENFDEFRQTVSTYTLDRVSQITGVPEHEIIAAADLLSSHRPMATIWSMGITQHSTGVMNVLSLGNLQMLLGNMGVAGGGVNPLRGQNNVQGACDMGALPNVYPGYQAVATAAAKFQQAWQWTGGGAPPAEADAGLTVTEMIAAAGAGAVRGLYILGEDPAMTEPDCGHARQLLAATEFVVLQEILHSETAEFADVLLPGAAFAEKEGTFTNTERRVQRVRRAVAPPGEARPDWAITAEIARRIMQRLGGAPVGPCAAWRYESASQIMAEIATLTPSYAGVSHRRLDAGERLQWPVLSADHPGTPILHVGKFTRGLGQFHAVEHLEPQELPDEDYPLLLTTGRVLYHWHGGELTRRSAELLEIYPQTLLEISPSDAARYGLQSGQELLVRSRRGEMRASALVTDRVAPGVVFGNFHFPGPANVNNLTIAALDPIAKIPEYKVCAVRIEVGADADGHSATGAKHSPAIADP